MNDEEMGITLGVRVSKTLKGRLEKVQDEHKKLTGIEPTLSDVIRMLIERGLEANGKRRMSARMLSRRPGKRYLVT